MGMGLGQDGAMAEFVVVPSARHLIPLGEVDPVEAAPLTDAALTPYHAIAACRHRLTRESTAVVIGVGGLGHAAVQLLRAMTACRVVAVDNRAAALALADRSGAHLATPATPDAPRVIRAATTGQGADLVLDFVGSAETLALAVSVLATDSDLVVIGSGGGHLPLAKSRLPQGTRISMPFWGTLPELSDVVGLAQQGLLHVEVERFGLSEAPQAVAALRSGRLAGRAVLIPDL
jgi:propanol-preferring alcohol dehydrogenase